MSDQKTTIPDEPAFAVVDASGRIDPQSVRRFDTTCAVYAHMRDLAPGTFKVVPVRIVADVS